jgi:phospholipase C
MPPQIKHLVVLMMENRSFDHMLGFLQSDTFKIEGIASGASNPPATGDLPVVASPDALASGDLNPDPGHDLINVNVQIFGNQQGIPDGPLMQGFVRDYALVSNDVAHGNKIMKCFNERSLPVLSTLARQYAVCDHWFSSVPGPTIPNRMFAHAATSLGSVVQDPDCWNLKTIYEVLDSDPNNPSDYRIYHHNFGTILLTVQHLVHDQHGFREYNQFDSDCRNGDLPAYTFIEPRYSDDTSAGSLFVASDQHPNHDVWEGEALIAEVFHSIVKNKSLWQSTLLLIVYDEHGGIFDHVPPPALTQPFLPASVDPAFSFDRLGIRVPAVLVSPFIKPGTIDSTQYEHSSIVATVRKLFAPSAGPLTVRDAAAKTFEGILNLDTARNDVPIFPDAVAAGPTPPSGPRQPTELAITMAESMQRALQHQGIVPTQNLNSMYTSADATNFMRAAAQSQKGNGNAS